MKKNKKPSGAERVYQSDDYYRVGQHVYHPVFQDSGKIVRKMPAPNNLNFIIVRFERVGEKKLIARKKETIPDEHK